MYILATFESSNFIELAISKLQNFGITKEQILAAPLDKPAEARQLFDSIHRSDGHSLFDAAAILGTCGMLLGAIYGYVLYWGPIIWGIIGAVSGLLVGFFIKLAMTKKSKNGVKKTSEIILMIHCEESQKEIIEIVLLENFVLGMTSISD